MKDVVQNSGEWHREVALHGREAHGTAHGGGTTERYGARLREVALKKRQGRRTLTWKFHTLNFP